MTPFYHSIIKTYDFVYIFQRNQIEFKKEHTLIYFKSDKTLLLLSYKLLKITNLIFPKAGLKWAS